MKRKKETMTQREPQISQKGEERQSKKHWTQTKKKSQQTPNGYHLEQSDMASGTTGLLPVQSWKWAGLLWQASIVQRTAVVDPSCHIKQVEELWNVQI